MAIRRIHLKAVESLRSSPNLTGLAIGLCLGIQKGGDPRGWFGDIHDHADELDKLLVVAYTEVNDFYKSMQTWKQTKKRAIS